MSACVNAMNDPEPTEMKLGVKIPWNMRPCVPTAYTKPLLLINTLTLRITEAKESLSEGKKGYYKVSCGPTPEVALWSNV